MKEEAYLACVPIPTAPDCSEGFWFTFETVDKGARVERLDMLQDSDGGGARAVLWVRDRGAPGFDVDTYEHRVYCQRWYWGTQGRIELPDGLGTMLGRVRIGDTQWVIFREAAVRVRERVGAEVRDPRPPAKPGSPPKPAPRSEGAAAGTASRSAPAASHASPGASEAAPRSAGAASAPAGRPQGPTGQSRPAGRTQAASAPSTTPARAPGRADSPRAGTTPR